jgi:hypothetical protein
MLGLGVVPPLSLLYLRVKLREPEAYVRNAMKKTPVWMTVKVCFVLDEFSVSH